MHDEHADDHGEVHTGDVWGDYNTLPPAPSNLPPLTPLALGAFGVALAVLLGMLVTASFTLARAPETPHDGGSAPHAEQHEEHQ